MEFLTLTEYFERLESTSKRLEMFEILAELFKSSSAEDIDKIVYMSQGQLLPPFHGLETGISEKLIERAIAEASDEPVKKVEHAYKETGDMGLAAEGLLRGRKGYGLTVLQVYEELTDIAMTGGTKSVERKIGMLANLFRGMSPKEAKYIARLVIGKLRLGIGDPTFLESLSLAQGDRELRPVLERAYNICSDLGLVAKTLLEKGMEGISKMRVTVGYPIRMALCERLPSPEDIIAKMGTAAIEAKYDGFRVQCHKDGDKIEMFSRNLEKTTRMFPEIAAAVLKYVRAKRAIIEGEALAYNEESGELLPFQVTIQRKRKHGIEELSKELPLKFFVFDLLYLDDEDYTEKPFTERRAKLEAIIDKNSIIEPSEMVLTGNPADIHRLFENTIERGLEGAIAKRPDAPYAAGARNFNWIKLKRSYKGELSDTVDVCIVGYFTGRGARTKFGIGGLLGAVYDPESETFKTLSKIGSGFSDEEFAQLKTMLDGIKLKHKHKNVDSDMSADIWVEPRYVISVTADEITRSPMHTAGRDKEGIGYALRFPRAKGFIRTDKKAEDANTVSEIIDMYEQQKKVSL
ncbi:MAG: ATP-dependent DNA ligase [Nitrospirae bacterium]|nr:MAG: ATP-dependent DNA ligase [Nitrospirota bacterium]